MLAVGLQKKIEEMPHETQQNIKLRETDKKKQQEEKPHNKGKNWEGTESKRKTGMAGNVKTKEKKGEDTPKGNFLPTFPSPHSQAILSPPASLFIPKTL